VFLSDVAATVNELLPGGRPARLAAGAAAAWRSLAFPSWGG